MIYFSISSSLFFSPSKKLHRRRPALWDWDSHGELVNAHRLLRFFASSCRGKDTKMEGVTTIGLVGYPNVGKSSTINAILRSKKVAVSATPGKTKHFQVRAVVLEVGRIVSVDSRQHQIVSLKCLSCATSGHSFIIQSVSYHCLSCYCMSCHVLLCHCFLLLFCFSITSMSCHLMSSYPMSYRGISPTISPFLQTIYVDPSLMLCDCPGLVFPSFVTSKEELILNGILPVDQLR